MKRPSHIWTAFGVCLLIVVAGMGWLTVKTVELDKSSRQQQAMLTLNADFEGDVRLALRRMDQELAELFAEESAWPHFAYQSFIFPQGISPGGKGDPPPTPVASPLLVPPNLCANLYFQVDPDNNWISPQIPFEDQVPLALQNGLSSAQIDNNRSQLLRCQTMVSPEELIKQLPEAQPTGQWKQGTVNLAAADAQPQQVAANGTAGDQSQNSTPPVDGQQAADQPVAPDRAVANAEEAQQPAPQPVAQGQQGGRRTDQQPVQQTDDQLALQGQQEFLPQGKLQRRGRVLPESQTLRGNFEYQSRQKQFIDFTNKYNAQIRQRDIWYGNNDANLNPILKEQLKTEIQKGKPPEVLEGRTLPLWIGTELVLARRVVFNGNTVLQGVWLDWSKVKQRLADKVGDLLPELDIVPVHSVADAEESRMLAGLPAELVVEPPRIDDWSTDESLSPILMSLMFAWGCLLLAAAAVAMLLYGVLSLSERRAAFVSAVTHELRTPLTTFRMYAEMLAENMVPDQQRRQQYLNTLKTEADRLFHLVENVLSYARLERGGKPSQRTRVNVRELLDDIQRRLVTRAERDDMQLVVEMDDAAGRRFLNTDVAAVEQIVVNLVDNACKYASTATDRRVHLRAEADGSSVALRVCDHGPGISAHEAQTLFRPFTKSAREAAHSAPGVGLGLALCRRMARDIGGKLWLDPPQGDGACFVLRLPATPS